jgi:hypothetical protein
MYVIKAGENQSKLNLYTKYWRAYFINKSTLIGDTVSAENIQTSPCVICINDAPSCFNDY